MSGNNKEALQRENTLRFIEAAEELIDELGKDVGIEADGSIHIVEMVVSAMALVVAIIAPNNFAVTPRTDTQNTGHINIPAN